MPFLLYNYLGNPDSSTHLPTPPHTHPIPSHPIPQKGHSHWYSFTLLNEIYASMSIFSSCSQMHCSQIIHYYTFAPWPCTPPLPPYLTNPKGITLSAWLASTAFSMRYLQACLYFSATARWNAVRSYTFTTCTPSPPLPPTPPHPPQGYNYLIGLVNINTFLNEISASMSMFALHR